MMDDVQMMNDGKMKEVLVVVAVLIVGVGVRRMHWSRASVDSVFREAHYDLKQLIHILWWCLLYLLRQQAIGYLFLVIAR
jgi:hypothetical protein